MCRLPIHNWRHRPLSCLRRTTHIRMAKSNLMVKPKVDVTVGRCDTISRARRPDFQAAHKVNPKAAPDQQPRKKKAYRPSVLLKVSGRPLFRRQHHGPNRRRLFQGVALHAMHKAREARATSAAPNSLSAASASAPNGLYDFLGRQPSWKSVREGALTAFGSSGVSSTSYAGVQPRRWTPKYWKWSGLSNPDESVLAMCAAELDPAEEGHDNDGVPRKKYRLSARRDQ